ncbi:MAG TPA: TIR domain-containing protein [Solirubrobacteraceae bacterium]
MADVFISYSHADRAFAVRLRTALADRDMSVFVDEEDIPPASRWASDLASAIEEASAFVFVISPDSVASVECRKELDHAAAVNKRLIPVNHRETAIAETPAALASHNFVPARGLFEDDFERSLSLLLSAIETDLDWVREHTAWGSKALEWDTHRRDRSFLLSGTELSAAERFLAASAGREPQPTQLQNNYVIASRQAATRRQRRLLSGVSLALVVAIGLGIVALIQRSAAVANQNKAVSGEYAARAENELGSDPETSMQMSLRGLAVRYTPPAEIALRDALPDVQVLRQVSAPDRPSMTSASFSPGGTQIVTVDADTARVWSVATGKPGVLLAEPGGAVLTSASFSPNGGEIATSSADGTARVWSASTGKLLATAGKAGQAGLVGLYAVAWSPTGKLILTASQDGLVTAWTPAGKLVGRLPDAGAAASTPYPDPVYGVQFSANGRDILAATQGGQAIVYALDARAPEYIGKNLGAVGEAVFNRQGNEIATADGDGTAKIWNTASGHLLATFGTVGGPVIRSVAFSPAGGELLTAGHAGLLEVWDIGSGHLLLSLSGHTGLVNTAEFDQDGGEIVSAGADGTARIWDALPREARTVVREPGASSMLSASFSPDGSLLATASVDGNVRVWRVASGKQVSDYSEPGGSASTVAFNSAGTELLVASGDKTARIVDARTGRELGEPIEAGKEFLLDASWSPDGREFVTADQDGTAKIYRADGTLLHQLPIPGRVFVYSAVFSPSGRDVLTADQAGQAQVWNAVTDTPVGAPIEDPGHVGLLTANYNRAGTEIVTSSTDGRAEVWDVATHARLAEVTAPGGVLISNATFSPSGVSIVTADDDGTARIWALPSGKQLTVLGSYGGWSMVSAVFNAKGNEVATVDEGGRAVVWSTQLVAPLGDLAGIAHSRVTVPLSAAQEQSLLAGGG